MASKTEQEFIANKLAIMQVLGNLCKNPLLLLNTAFKLSPEDFPERFHQIVFGALQNLAAEGFRSITPIDVDQFLAPHTSAYHVFTANNGLQYIGHIVEIASADNFEAYYKILKKHSVLARFASQGFDITELYDESVVDVKKNAEMQEKFNQMDVDDIITHFEGKLLSIKTDYSSNNNIVKNHASDGIEEYLEQLEEEPEFGLPLSSPTLTTVYRGQRLGGFYLESSAQGVGKSRRSVAEAVNISIPERYDTQKKKWVKNGLCEPTALFSTELSLNETHSMLIATIAGVPEHHILDNRYTEGEKERVVKATRLLKESSLYYVEISDYNMDDIEDLVKEYYVTKGVRYFYYDYLSTTIKIMSEGAMKSRISGLQEHQVLLMFCTRLKDLCKRLQVFMWSATQLSGEWKKVKDADQQLLRGAKAISDKIDIGSILLPVREDDRPVIDTYMRKGFVLQPTHVIHLYKARRSRYTELKLYVHFDRSLCWIYDCFVTDNSGNLLNIEKTNIELLLERHSKTSGDERDSE